ncbi:MFS transporter [Pleionea sediminis]|uniref:MFS transporter n=1 Tax=Pleionea sediminis TaxID=2569479 RepID=UPI0013DD8B2B|nr:MFS transporter [Pleionea sediminis]
MSHKLPKQVWLFTLCYALMLSGTSMLVLIAGIIGSQIAPSEQLATLPIALAIVGLALNAIPASFLMSRYGRKRIFLSYAVVGILSALIASYALMAESFALFCVAATGVGAGAAAVQQYRFAAMELVPTDTIPKAASTILLGGILAAFIGPEMSLLGKNLLSVEYAGSFILLAALYCVGFLLLTRTQNSVAHAPDGKLIGRPLKEIFSQQTVIIAVLAAAVGYGVMAFIMTATPLSMHNHFGHSLTHTKWVIQSHVAAMYLPSLISGLLVERLGHYRMMAFGLVAFLICLIIAYTSQTFAAFWLALVLLGIGWNFLFVAGTSLLPTAYRPQERFKVQAFNDLLVFGTQALASLSSGWLLFQFKWQGILIMSTVPVFIIAGILAFTLFNRRVASDT